MQFFYKAGHYSKFNFGECSAKFNTNISLLWLHINDWHANFSVKTDTFRRKFLLEYILLYSILIFPRLDYINVIEFQSNWIKQGIIRKFILGNILLHSILIFQGYDCIKTIEIQNFSVKKDKFWRKFLFSYYLLHSIQIFIFYDYKKAIDIPNFNVKT